MRAFEAYQAQRTNATSRVDLVVTLYRKTLDWLDRASVAIAAGQTEAATPLLARAQLVISSLASGVALAHDDVSSNFLRLYEYAAHCLSKGTESDIGAARNILRTLMEGFESARAQAIALEASGQLPPLGREHEVQLTV